MIRQVAVEDVLQHTTLQPAEAVAIVQQLIHAPAPTSLTEPFGPPTAATVFVGTDGSVTCTTCDAPLVVSELAALLDVMLPPGGTSPIVPGGLRYIVARARMEVDAPPFDSVFEFSQALARHERGDRSAVIQSALARIKAHGADDRLERRRTDPAVTVLRRQLRDADVRVYDQQRAIDALSAMSTRPPAGNRAGVLAAGVLIGLAFVGAGELMRHDTNVTSPPVVSASNVPSPPPAAVVPPVPPQVTAPAGRAAKTPVVHPVKRTAPTSTSSRDRTSQRSRRFQWLKTRFVLRADPL
jgi:hypothetical protein